MDDAIKDFVDSLSHYLSAKEERDKCYSECDYDAGYFCYDQAEALEQATNMLKDSLKIVVKEALND